MDSEHLSRLVDRYFRGETSLEEEATLRRILSQRDGQQDDADAFRTTPEARAAAAMLALAEHANDGKAPLHPDHPERGNRTYHLEGDKRVYLSKADADTFTEAGKIRLKDLCNVSYDGAAHYDGNDLSVLKRGVHAVQWVGEDSVPATLLMPDGTQHEGRIERSVLDEAGDTVQLERVGFARIEGKSADGVHMVYSHR